MINLKKRLIPLGITTSPRDRINTQAFAICHRVIMEKYYASIFNDTRGEAVPLHCDPQITKVVKPIVMWKK